MEKKRSAAFYLHHTLWAWRVPEYLLVTEYATNTHGLALPESAAKANAILNSRTLVNANAALMAEVFAANQGIPLDMNTPTDGKELYELIMEHLADWVSYASRPQLLPRIIPIQGLREFNILAKKVFTLAHRHGYYEKPIITFASSLQALMSGGANDGMVRVTHAFNDRLMMQLESLHRAQTRSIKSMVRT